MRYVLGVIVVLFASCCAPNTTNYHPAYMIEDMEPLTPLPQYEQWYEEVLDCMGELTEESPRFETIDWYVAENITKPDSVKLNGLGWRNVIYLDSDRVEIENTVKHELLHFLMDQSLGFDGIRHRAVWWDDCVPPEGS